MASIKRFRQLSRSTVSPAEQVGEQFKGITGWRAAWASRGIAGGATDNGAEGFGLLVQALASSASVSKVPRSAGELGGLRIVVLLLPVEPALCLSGVLLGFGQCGRVLHVACGAPAPFDLGLSGGISLGPVPVDNIPETHSQNGKQSGCSPCLD